MPEPTKIPRPFADSGDKNSIPDSSGALGFASWQEGFPAITGTPFAQGGVAPKRADFNGIFNALSAATVWNQQGGVYAYDATTDYEVGNVVEYSGNLYKCITANGPSSAVKAPTDTTVWDAIATASGYLPLSGGTMTGNLTFSGAYPAIVVATTDSYIRINNQGYNGGASMYLNGKDRSTDAGTFSIIAYDGANRKVFAGGPGGTLTWDGKDVVTVETGTWTPTLYGASTAGVLTYSRQTGYYVRMNNIVYITAEIDISDVTTYPSGAARVGGLPFATRDVRETSMGFAYGNSGADNSFNRTHHCHAGQNKTYFEIFMASNTNPGRVRYGTFSQSPGEYNLTLNSSNKTGEIYCELWYRTD